MAKLKNLLPGTLVLHCFDTPLSFNPGQVLTVSDDQAMNAEVQRLATKGALQILKDDAKVKPEKVVKTQKKEQVFEVKQVKSEKNNDVVVVEKKATESKATKTDKKPVKKAVKSASPKTTKNSKTTKTK